MNVLFLTPLPPLPLDSGGQIRIYEFIRSLSKKHDIYLISFATDKQKKRLVDYGRLHYKKLKEICKHIIIIDYEFDDSLLYGFKKLLEYVKYTASGKPLCYIPYYNKNFIEAVKFIVKDVKIDVVQFENLTMSQYSSFLHPRTKLVLSEHNVETEIIDVHLREDRGNIIKRFIRNMFFAIDTRNTFKFELEGLGRFFSAIITISNP